MISSLFFLKFNIKRLLGWLFAALLLGALSAFAYTPAPREALRYVREEMPELFLLLGVRGDSNLPAFVLGYLFGALLPLMVSLYAIRANRNLLSRPMEDGRMAMLIASGHRRSAILLTHVAALFLGLALVLLTVFIGQLAMALVFSLNMDLLSFLRMHGGFLCVSLLFAAACLLIALLSADDTQMKRWCRALAFFMLLFLLLSRLHGWWQHVRFLSIWSLFDGRSLAFGSGGFEPALIALLAAVLCVVFSLFVFQRREL